VANRDASRSLALIRRRSFRLLLVGRTISRFGTAMTPVALAFAVLQLTGSASALGWVLAAFGVSQLAFVPLAGVWADRLPRQRVMVASNLVEGSAQAILAVLLLGGWARMWEIATIAVLTGIGTAFYGPASQGIVPEVVPPAHIQEANALLRTSLNVAHLLGAGAGGLIVALANPGAAIAIDASTYFACAVTLGLIPIATDSRAATRDFLGEIREGWSAFTSRSWLWSSVACFALINAVGSSAYYVLGPVVARRDLGGPGAWGTILSIGSFGYLVGGAVSWRFRPAHPLRAGVLVMFLYTLPLILLAAASPLALVALGAGIAGFALELFGVLWDTTLQTNVPRQTLARVAAYDLLGSLALVPLGYAIVGPASALVGVSTTLAIAAAVVVVLLCANLASGSVRGLKREPAEAAAR
jgi:MFS family permease